ncbi:MAG: M1 family metallopeptidase, partial [Ginsengibacter sp.]
HLYHETKYGVDSFNKRMQTDRNIVIAFSRKINIAVVDTMPVKNLMQLLNANSYQKGGWVLHMLRRKIGDSLFWKGIRSYYATYAGSNAGTEDLCKIFEKVSHQNFQTFFKQWLYTPGQPKLDVEWKYDERKKSLSIKVIQLQDNLFTFPLEIGFGDENKKNIKTIYIKSKITESQFSVKNKPVTISADPNVNLLFEGDVKEMK